MSKNLFLGVCCLAERTKNVSNACRPAQGLVRLEVHVAVECRRHREVPGCLQHGLLANDRSFDHLRRQCSREEHRTGNESRNESYRGDGERPLHRSIQRPSRFGMIRLRWQNRLFCVMWRSGETNNENARWAIERYKLGVLTVC